eukprot:8075063-Alexandrium_andersonii.AAC.1
MCIRDRLKAALKALLKAAQCAVVRVLLSKWPSPSVVVPTRAEWQVSGFRWDYFAGPRALNLRQSRSRPQRRLLGSDLCAHASCADRVGPVSAFVGQIQRAI